MTSPSVTDAIHQSDAAAGQSAPAVSLRELHAALLAPRPGPVAGSRSPDVTSARTTTVSIAAPAHGVDTEGSLTGGDSRRGGRLSPPPSAPPALARVTVVATHGGAGARCVAAVLGATVDRSWPADPGPDLSPVPVLLVCRSHARGVSSAQRFAREYRDGECAGAVVLLGCAVVADAPGRLPIGLRRLQRLLAAAVPRVWTVPWVPAWRLAPPDPTQRPEWATRLRADLDQAVGR